MRIQLLSDVHVEFHADRGRDFVTSLDPTDVDVLVLAGDIAVGSDIVAALGSFCARYANARVVYVHGNHEYYGTDRESVVGFTHEAMRANRNLIWLDSAIADIGGRRFIGGPLWFERSAHAEPLRRSMADFGQITGFESWVYDENRRMRDLLHEELRAGDIVVTHHLPTRRSVAPRFKSSPLNAFFVCDVEDLIIERRPALWMHGHTHCSVDEQVGATRVLCNPFGYAGWELNSEFSEATIVEVGSS